MEMHQRVSDCTETKIIRSLVPLSSTTCRLNLLTMLFRSRRKEWADYSGPTIQLVPCSAQSRHVLMKTMPLLVTY